MQSQFSLYALIHSEDLLQTVTQRLDPDHYCLHYVASNAELVEHLQAQRHQVDAILIQVETDLDASLQAIYDAQALLPLVVVSLPQADVADAAIPFGKLQDIYHPAIATWTPNDADSLDDVIKVAIEEFLQLPPNQVNIPSRAFGSRASQQSKLVIQQRRLATKLKERLGYLGVYYKRNPAYFLRNMNSDERTEFLDELRHQYRAIVLSYFSDDPSQNNKIDEFVNTAFFADTSVPQIVEIHMDLMDEFAKQLQIEGRSEEILLDYRLTLIDVIAHLCEMYRRSIPRDT